MINLRQESPFRPPDWRWQKARLLREQGRRASRRRDDEWVTVARNFQGAVARCANDWQLADLAEQFPALVDARQLAEQDGVQSFKWELEARLLANESPDRIAERMVLPATTVRAYEALFFNVQDRLRHLSWIVHAVFGRSIHAGLNERQYDLLWKMYGYFGGAHLVDFMVDTFGDAGKAAGPDKVRAWLENDQRESLARKAAIAARTIPVNSYTQPAILEIAQKYYEIEKAAGTAAGQSAVLGLLNDVMASMAWSVGGGTPENPVPALAPRIDGFAAEMRVTEMFALTAGREEDLAGVSTLTFPEASQNVAHG